MERSPVFELAERLVRYTNRNVFLTGKAGTGKTTFLHHIRKEVDKKMAVVAPTGVAALNAGGVTLHSLFGLPPAMFLPKASWKPGMLQDPAGHEFLKGVRLSSDKRAILKSLELLVIDEVSMLRADTLDAMDLVLRDVRKGQRSVPFGGVQLLFIGDLHQLPPVVNDDEWNLLSRHYPSPFFFDALALRASPPLHVELTHIYRQDDRKFISLLNNIRHNTIDEEDVALLHEYYDPKYEPEEGSGVITLTTHNALAEEINNEALQRLGGTPEIFEGILTGEFNDKVLPAERALLLKKDAQVMFVKNDKGDDRRFYNGKIGVVDRIDFEKNVWVRFPDGSPEVKVAPEKWKSVRYKYNELEDRIEEEEIGSYEQLPLRLAWAVTIHKSQGLTFDRAIVDAGKAFAPGQVYVALSRLRSLDGLVLKSKIGPSAVRTDERIARFNELKPSSGALERAMEEGQRDWAARRLLNCFEWTEWSETCAAHARSYEGLAIEDRDAARDWFFTNVLSPVQELYRFGQGFCRQLAGLLDGPREEKAEEIAARVDASVVYFKPKLQALSTALKEHGVAWRLKRHARHYLKEIAHIERSCMLILASLESVMHLASALYPENDPAPILDVAEAARRGALPKVASSASGVPLPPKQARGDSYRATVALFNQGRTLEEIAVLRNLALSTLEGHLAQGISSGELELERFVSKEKTAVITSALAQYDGSSISQIKEALGDSYSYAEIRAVQAHQTRKAEDEHPAAKAV
jgi:hypothetical protein